VYSVLSQAFSGSGSFGKSADPKALEVALKASFSNSETASTISRTQTINMLKEMMYRTCERFINGQIDKSQYPIIAARDQRIMVSILAIEQLTSSLLPKPSAIAASGNASAGKSTSDAILSVDNAKKNVDESEKALEVAKKEYDTENGSGNACAALAAKAQNKEPLTDAEKSKLLKCEEKKSVLENAEKKFTKATNYYEKLTALIANADASSATTSAILPVSFPATEIDKQIEETRSQRIQAVANVVKEIAIKSFNQDDETSFFCYDVFNRYGLENKLSQPCITFLLAKVESETESLRRQIEKSETTAQMEKEEQKRFAVFWEYVKDKQDKASEGQMNLIFAEFEKAYKGRYETIEEEIQEMKKATEKNIIFNAFGQLAIPIQRNIVEIVEKLKTKQLFDSFWKKVANNCKDGTQCANAGKIQELIEKLGVDGDLKNKIQEMKDKEMGAVFNIFIELSPEIQKKLY